MWPVRQSKTSVMMAFAFGGDGHHAKYRKDRRAVSDRLWNQLFLRVIRSELDDIRLSG
jgi:hypothetical protein